MIKLSCMLFLFVGCAHTCLTPEERASDLGMVMECKNQTKNGRSYRQCKVLTDKEMKTVTYRVCK